MNEEWGVRLGSGDIITMAEAIGSITIGDSNLRIRTGNGPWRIPTDDELRRFLTGEAA